MTKMLTGDFVDLCPHCRLHVANDSLVGQLFPIVEESVSFAPRDPMHTWNKIRIRTFKDEQKCG